MKNYIIIAAVILFLLLIPKKTAQNTNTNMLAEDDIIDSLRQLKNKYGREKAAMIERLLD